MSYAVIVVNKMMQFDVCPQLIVMLMLKMNWTEHPHSAVHR